MKRIVIELVPGASPIAGRVTACEQPPVPFTGWTALFSVLRSAAALAEDHHDDGGGQR
jgi:hypothetical protein